MKEKSIADIGFAFIVAASGSEPTSTPGDGAMGGAAAGVNGGTGASASVDESGSDSL